MRPNTSAGPEMRRGAQAVSGGCVLDTPELFAYEKLGLRGRAKRVARPEVVRKGHGPSTVDLPVPSLHMLSTKRRPLNYVSMKTNRGRQPMVPKPVSDACYAPKYSLTDKAVLCKFSVNARAPPRFGRRPPGPRTRSGSRTPASSRSTARGTASRRRSSGPSARRSSAGAAAQFALTFGASTAFCCAYGSDRPVFVPGFSAFASRPFRRMLVSTGR